MSSHFQFTLCAGIALGEGCLVDLRTVLVGGAAELERTRIEILVDIAAVEPVVSEAAVDVQGELLQSEVVRLVVERAVEAVLSEFRKGVDGADP